MENPAEADILFGIKEVPIEFLSKGKTYFFFSHTIKKQAHNRALLQALLKQQIEMVDYECLQDSRGERTVAFGRFAGIVGAYNAFRMYLQKFDVAILPAASSCKNMAELIDQIRVWLPSVKGIKIAITGTGRVGSGAAEVLKKLEISELLPEDFLNYSESKPAFTILRSKHYMKQKTGIPWDETAFRIHPENFESCFLPFASQTDILIPCHFWNPKAPALFAIRDIGAPTFRISIVSDVTCDIEGSIPTTLRASKIAEPFYDVDREKGIELPAFSARNTITVCAVDNLPCELPYDASFAFGEMLTEYVIPELTGNARPSIAGATICRDGNLLPAFEYLRDFAEEGHA